MTLLGLKYPIFEAPHGIKVTSPELAIAVSNAGAMGALAISGWSSDKARDALSKVRAATKGSFFVNYILALSNQPDTLRTVLEATRERSSIGEDSALWPPCRFRLRIEQPSPQAAPIQPLASRQSASPRHWLFQNREPQRKNEPLSSLLIKGKERPRGKSLLIKGTHKSCGIKGSQPTN